jgi:hypothetical protein
MILGTMGGSATVPMSSIQIMPYFISFSQVQAAATPVVIIQGVSYTNPDPSSVINIGATVLSSNSNGFTVQLINQNAFTGWSFPVTVIYNIIDNGTFFIYVRIKANLVLCIFYRTMQ